MKFVLIAFMVILILTLIKKAYKNTKDIKLNEMKINQDPSNAYNPTLSILQLSDLHLENISITPEELYEKLKDKKIDLIALTGDFLDRKRTIPKLVPYLEVLNKLDAKHGIFAVLGNHDYVLKKVHLETLIGLLEKYNCKVLRNENETISIKGQRVNIIGIDDFSTKRSQLDSSYKEIQPGTNLVLTHDPNIVLHMQNYHFDYLLSGHFHGGQICYPRAYHLAKMGKLARMNKIKGFHMQDGKPYYISEGLGQTGVNIRVGSRPEITIHELALTTAKNQGLEAI
ncbi:metallophosphoesterase [Mesobacillus maritimus]|uniref:metallophosphoesterase n=1 Tax=Mesobacillus maritimus TaxID=1643336 RepID=UPI00384C7F02